MWCSAARGGAGWRGVARGGAGWRGVARGGERAHRCAWATSATLLEMTSGTRASSMSTLSPSSTTQKLSSRETTWQRGAGVGLGGGGWAWGRGRGWGAGARVGALGLGLGGWG